MDLAPVIGLGIFGCLVIIVLMWEFVMDLQRHRGKGVKEEPKKQEGEQSGGSALLLV